MTNNDFTKGADDSAMTSRQRARPALRLVKPGQRSGVNAFSASAVSSFELTGLLQGVDKPPRAAALATFIEGLLDGEGFDVVHTTDRPGNRPSRYSLEVRLHQRIPVRPQALSEAMAQCLGSAQPSLAFAQTGGAPGLPGPANGFADHETRLLTSAAAEAPLATRAVLVPAPLQLSRKQSKQRDFEVWNEVVLPCPVALPNWPLTSGIDEPLCGRLRMTIRLRAVAIDAAALDRFRKTRQQLLAGSLVALHPLSPQDVSSVDTDLAESTVKMLAHWLARPRGYVMDLVLDSDQALTPYAMERLGRDVYGKHPFWAHAVDGDLPAVGGPQAVPVPMMLALPGLFAPTELLKQAGVAAEELPVDKLPQGPGADIGEAGRGQRVIVPDAWRASHMALVGGSGTGKSTLLKRMLSQDFANGHGVALIDVHGDLCDEVLAIVPGHRAADVVVVDVEDREFSVGLNPMQGTYGNPQQEQYVAAALTEILEGLYETATSTGPALRGHMKNSFLLAMCHPEGGTLHDAFRIHQDADLRDYLLSKANPLLRKEIQSLVESPGSEHSYRAWLPYLNPRLGLVSQNPLLLRLLSRPSTVRLDHLMNQRAIVLFRISKGVLQNLEAQLLGSLIFLQINMAAMARASLPPSERRPFFVYIDEFSVLATKAMPSAFRELRKFNVGLVIATQTWSSMSGRTENNDLANEVLANTSCKVSFRVSPKDARLLDDYTEPRFNAVALTRTPNHQAVVSFSAQGAESFMVRVTPPARPADALDAAGLRHLSGKAHGKPIHEVNGYLAERHGIDLQLLTARS